MVRSKDVTRFVVRKDRTGLRETWKRDNCPKIKEFIIGGAQNKKNLDKFKIGGWLLVKLKVEDEFRDVILGLSC